MDAISRIVSLFCFCHNVIPSQVRLALVDTILSLSLANCAQNGFSVIVVFFSLKSSSSLLIQLHFDFFRSSHLIQLVFSESLGIIFAMYFIAPRNDFSSLHDVGDFNCNMVFILLLFCSVFGYLVYQPNGFVDKKFGSFLACLYLVSWSCFVILNNLFGVYLCPLLLLLLCRLATLVFHISLFCLFFSRIMSVYLIDLRVLFESMSSNHIPPVFAKLQCLLVPSDSLK